MCKFLIIATHASNLKLNAPFEVGLLITGIRVVQGGCSCTEELQLYRGVVVVQGSCSCTGVVVVQWGCSCTWSCSLAFPKHFSTSVFYFRNPLTY